MYKKILEDLTQNKFINNNKISPWLERKIDLKLKEEILKVTNFILVEVSLSDRVRTMILEITKQPLCLHCNKPTKFHRELNNYAKYCSKKCFNISQEKKENLSKLAKEEKLAIGKKSKEYQKKKYNGLMAIQANSNIKEKIKQTCIEKYGVDNVFKTKQAKEIVKNNRKRYKEQFEQNINITKELLYKKYVIENKTINQCSDYFKCSPMYIWSKLYEYNIPINYNWTSSSYEKELVEFLIENNIDFISNFRKLIPPKEVDVYIESHKLAIEINGLWFHHDCRKNRGKYYHKDKYLFCKEKKVNLIQFYDTEWLLKNNICKSIILTKLGLNNKIFARKCEIREVNQQTSRLFLDENHIQGDVKSKYRFGLYYNNELVSLMTFGIDRFNKKSSSIELYRFCNKIGFSVVGGASKLFKYFLKTNSEKIISYCDIRLFDGNLYEKLGFKFSHFSNPNYYYFNSKYILENRIKYQKHKLKNILEKFDPELTEYENMLKNNFLRIWDCGNKVYVWEKEY